MLAISYILSCNLYIFFGKASMQTFCPTFFFFWLLFVSLLSFFSSCSGWGRLLPGTGFSSQQLLLLQSVLWVDGLQ